MIGRIFEPVNSKTVCKYKRDYSFYCKTRKHWKVQWVYRQCLTHKGHRMLQVKENECMKTHTCHNYNSSSFTTVISLLLNLTRRTKTIYITIFIILNIFLIKWKRLYNVLFLTSWKIIIFSILNVNGRSLIKLAPIIDSLSFLS